MEMMGLQLYFDNKKRYSHKLATVQKKIGTFVDWDDWD
jgi:hypothetical protein